MKKFNFARLNFWIDVAAYFSALLTSAWIIKLLYKIKNRV